MSRRSHGTGSVYLKPRGRHLTIQYRIPGRSSPVRESTPHPPTTAGYAAAERLLRKKLTAIEAGTIAPESRRTTWADLTKLIRADYVAQRRRSSVRLDQSLAHLDQAFGGQRASAIGDARLIQYTADRLEEGAAPATVNRELAALRRAFRLGLEAGLVGRVPIVRRLQEPAGRKGFFDEELFEQLVGHLPADVALVARVAYITGWRVRSEILTRKWQHVDLKAGWLRLEPGETKNGQGRQFPMTSELRELLEAHRKATKALERETGQIIPWVFHRAGQPIRSFRRAWLTACVKAGVGKELRDTKGRVIRKTAERIPHDFRRTAVRNLERRGVPRSAAMAMVGHKTQAIYSRYAIVDETMLREAAKKLEGQG